MYWIGMIIGAIVATYVLGFLLDWAIFKRTGMSRGLAIALAAAAAITIAIVLYGFGRANGGPWNPGDGVIAYPIGGVIAGLLRYLRARGRGTLMRQEA